MATTIGAISTTRLPTVCFKEKQSTTNAFIEVLKVTTIPRDAVQVVKCKVSNLDRLNEQKLDSDAYGVTDCLGNSDRLQINECVASHIPKRMDVNVHNTSNGELRLVKGEIVGEVGLIESVTEDIRKKVRKMRIVLTSFVKNSQIYRTPNSYA